MNNKILTSLMYGIYENQKLDTPILNYYFSAVRVEGGIYNEMKYKRERLFMDK